MNKIFAVAAVAGLFVSGSAFAQATQDEVVAKVAKERGYTAEQTACFSRVAKSHATKDSTGMWVIPESDQTKKGQDYRAEMFKVCKIQR